MKKRLLLLTGLILTCLAPLVAQEQGGPTDYLSNAFHKGRRDALRSLMPANSVAIIFAYPVRNFSNDVDYLYHQNPDLYYLSGYNEPQSVLLIFKEPQQTKDGKSYNELFFIQKRDPQQESWTGRRLGVEGVKKLGFDMVFENREFANFELDLKKFSALIYDALPNDVRDDSQDPADLYDLIEQFKSKAGITKTVDPAVYETYDLIKRYDSLNRARVLSFVNKRRESSKNLQNDALLTSYVTASNDDARNKVVATISGINSPENEFNQMLGSLREIKTDEELVVLKKAIKISAIAHAEVMKAIQPGMSERQIQAIFQYVHMKYGAEWEGYPPIVGAGNNGCILHYEENNLMDIGNKMILADVAAEYHGYSADVTRTFPSNGKFTTEQLAIYNLVYDAQDAAIKLCKDGVGIDSLNKISMQIIAAGLKKLGIIASESEAPTYYPHGVSHHLGLDVHDKSNYGVLKSGMVITVEPGIYIPEGSKCDKKWWTIGVRIEDDVLITKTGGENLSADAPRKAADVEKMVAQKSVLNDYALPALK
ncbi:MAG: Xaa-Pro aminopeptidase [Bacteroidetes bacterium]|nr:MAG: Xaa-Pro aminopeptidase [Bacteroidota bacterium]